MDSLLEPALIALRPASPPLPEGACDCHAHVFGPFADYPLPQPSPYQPPHAPAAAYVAMLDRVGYTHGVLVHGGAHGWDHGALLGALRASEGRLRGIAVAPPEIADAELEAFAVAGVRGLRFTDTGRPAAPGAPAGRVGLAALGPLAPRMKALGWHAQVWASADIVARHAALLAGLDMPVVLDHMAFFDVDRGVADPSFQAVLSLVREGNVWVKLTPLRVSGRKQPSDMADVRPFHDALIAAAPDRMLWGSDWPFIGMTGDTLPDATAQIDRFAAWVDDRALFRKVLVTNPAALYGFAAPGAA